MIEAASCGCERPLAQNLAHVQFADTLAEKRDETQEVVKAGEQGPIGPAAGGKLTYSPAGFTGIRPVVDQYSVSKYTEAEWKKRVEDVLTTSAEDLHKINLIEYNSRRAIECIGGSADKNQSRSTIHLAERAHEVLRWKTEVERSIELVREEIDLLDECLVRVIQSKSVLKIVKSISDECLARRALREGHDLSNDKTEQELIKEEALIREVSSLLERTIAQLNEQLERNKDLKNRLENDWSDKMETLLIDSYNVSLNNRSLAVMRKPASVRMPEGQLSSAGWDNVVRELVAMAEALLGQSTHLRVLVNGPLLNDCIKDLKNQANKVDTALARGVVDTQQIIRAMYNELDIVVRRNTESENLIVDLKNTIRALEKALKVVQTRLDNRIQRPRNESTRDKAQFGLMEEATSLNEQITAMKGRLTEAESCLNSLVRARGVLERELQIKLKTLYIDKDRCQVMRAQYPSASLMIGL